MVELLCEDILSLHWVHSSGKKFVNSHRCSFKVEIYSYTELLNY